MKNLLFAGYIFLFVLGISCQGSPSKDEQIGNPALPQSLKLQVIATGLHSPVAAAFTPDGIMLVCEQTGVIRAINKNVLNNAPFLDIQSKLVALSGTYDERGLLGIALHPDYKTNRKFYVYYSAPSDQGVSDHKSVLAEYKTSSDPLQANAASERILLTVQEPESNHNGGDIHFGPDGYLYIGLGDGGGAGDKHGESGNGQNLNTFLGKILRIDVNTEQAYGIPGDNPFIGKSAKPEIWAYGLRNPWRFSFDRKTGKLFAADVGQNKFEEINIIEKGGNYGWRIMEATHCFDPAEGCKTEGLKLPINEYDHSIGISITGGFVYNGKSLNNFNGKYLFADWSGPLFYLENNGTSWSRKTIELTGKPSGNLKILSFAEDNDGELYVLTNEENSPKGTKGAVYKLINP